MIGWMYQVPNRHLYVIRMILHKRYSFRWFFVNPKQLFYYLSVVKPILSLKMSHGQMRHFRNNYLSPFHAQWMYSVNLLAGRI